MKERKPSLRQVLGAALIIALLLVALPAIPNAYGQLSEQVSVFVLEPVPITADTDNREIGEHLEFVCFPASEHDTLDQAVALDYQPLPSGKIHFGYFDKACWFRTRLKNSSAQPIEYYLTFQYALIDYIDAYLIEADHSVKHFQFGDKYPYHARPLETFDYTLRQQISGGEQHTLYFRAETTSTYNLPVFLNTEHNFLKNRYLSLLVLGIFYGVAAGLTAYNLFLYAATKQKAYFYYVIHV